MSDAIVVCRKSFAVDRRIVHQGETFRADSPIVEGRELFFEPFEVSLDGDVEQATAAPGERRTRRARPPKAEAEAPADDAPAEAPQAEAPADAPADGAPADEQDEKKDDDAPEESVEAKSGSAEISGGGA